jgi:dienelactone hydrolase
MSPTGPLRTRSKDELWLADGAGTRRDAFFPGDAVFVSGHGLPPVEAVAFALREGKRDVLLARYSTDRHGGLSPSLLIPHLEEAARRERVSVTVGDERRGSLDFTVEEDRVPRLFSTDRRGVPQTGVEEGDTTIGVTLRNFEPGCVRVHVVRRQFGWRVADPIEPLLSRDVAVRERVDTFVPFGRSSALGPGSYQFIARPFVPGWYQTDEPYLLAGDVVSDHAFASLVVRVPFDRRFEFENGVVLTPQIAGRPLAHKPYFHFLDNFPKGTDVYASLDPDALPSGLASTRAAIYVIAHKEAADWSASSALTDVSGPGMTPNVKIVPIVPGCVNWNTTLVWPNPQTPGKYDIAIDFGNNVADPSLFATDGTLDAPLDMIDGYVRVGFYVTEDPSLPGPYAGSIGKHDYALGTIQVPMTDAGPTPTDSLPITATVRYPAVSSGTDVPCAAGSFPLVVVMHGNSGLQTSYLGYNYLLDHLASHGFVAVSIYAPVGALIEPRARAILAHIGVMAQKDANPGLFQGHIDLARIGIVGHSRGGEAVVRAPIVNVAEGLGYGIKASIAIAPTDYNHYQAGVPLLVIYGANDGDVAGTWPDRTCFNIFDEASRPRSFVFVYGGTHDRFNTEWASIEASSEFTWHITPSDIPNLISLTAHENVAKGYVTAFLQAWVNGRDEQLAYFADGLKPSLVSSVSLHTTHQPAGATLLDDFEQLPHNVAVNTLGGAVTGTSLPVLAEDALHTLDVHSPHVTAGAAVAWQTSAGIYLSDVPAAARDLSAFRTLGFRVTQKYGSPRNPVNQPQDFFVRMQDGSGKSRAIRASVFTSIPYPYVRGEADLIKSALKSVRIPLASYTIANLGADDVDLADVASISFEFDAGSSGELEIDDIEFGE